MPTPTITGVPPETWEQILQCLNQFGVTVKDLTEMGITTWEGPGGLKEYLLNNGWELKEVWDLKQMWFYTGAGDATQSNALVQYVANKVTVAGTAGAEYAKHFTYGETILGKLKKGIIFGSIFALLVSSLDPSFITDALKSNLSATIDLFADENDDVPVILDGNGKIYYHEDMINALRQALIDAGVYATGGKQTPDHYTPINPSWTLNNPNDYNYPCSVFNGERISISGMVNGVLRTGYIDIPSDCFGLKTDTSDDDDGIFIWSKTLDNPITVTNIYGDVNTYTNPSATITRDGVTYYIRYYNPVRNAVSILWPNTASIDGDYISFTKPTHRWGDITGNSYRDDMIAILYNQNLTGGGGVEGITVADDLISRGIGNAQTALEDIFPSYATDKVTTINPSDEDITASDNWYPISTGDTDVWTDGITEQQSETAPDGEVDPDIKSEIADAIKDILDDYYRDPDDPNIINYPEIPVGDNGDTPPAEPPLISGSANGLWSIYNPTLQQVQDFGAYLWSENILDQITRMFNSPIDAVIGFHMIYCTPIKGAAKNIKCGYLDTGVSSITVANQYATIDCGTVEVPEYYRTALDYVSTKLALYLPFIGIVPLSTAVCIGATLQVIYRIDVLTGTCLAQVKVIKENSDAVMYTFTGNCSVQIPLTATTYTGSVSALIGIANTAISVAMENPNGAIRGVKETIGSVVEGMGTGGVRQSGGIGSNAGALGIRIPYLIITHPVSYDAVQYNAQYGYPLNQTISLGSVSGYTRVKDIHLAGIPCTDAELELIESLLKEGVIIN